MSEKVFETKELNQRNLNALYYKELRNTFGLKSQMAQSVMKTVLVRYKSAKSSGHVEKENRNKRTHTFCCKNCQYTSNDERIGAMNLHRKGVEAISAGAAPARVKSTILRGQPRIFRHTKAGASPDASALPDRNKPKRRLCNKRTRRVTTGGKPVTLDMAS
ncbi:hypothetical protein [Trichococcus palustris]|uniref:hypothetical protein n=1 Tax=Trichococcus palustris TaxID=140314 RepID=UPI001C433A92|nr:hypothetical protein [Trichococcus palustris]